MSMPRILQGLSTALLLLGASGSLQADPGPVPSSEERIALIESGTATVAAYIVQLEAPPVARYRGGIDGLAPTNPGVLGMPKLDVSTPASLAYLEFLAAEQTEFVAALDAALGRDVAIMAAYRVTLNGVALWLDKAEAPTVANLPGVKSIEEETVQKLTTDAGPEWIGAPTIWDGSSTFGGAATRGEGMITGIIDSGINSDHPSFAEVGPVDGYVHINPLADADPLTPSYLGNCDGTTGLPYCNDKLIGAYDCTTSAGSGGLSQPTGVATPTLTAIDPVRVPQAPVTQPFTGEYDGTEGALECGPFHTYAVPAGQTSVSAAATADVPLNDIFVDLYYHDPVVGPALVAHADTGTSPEVATYTPPGGVPPGNYSAQVCPFDFDLDHLEPYTYTGTFTYDDTPLPGPPGTPVLGCKGGTSPEDTNGHGSHTASTTAGNYVDATVVAPTITLNLDISGVAPHANIIAYYSCTPGGCVSVNTNAAIEQATVDQVDVINYSIGGDPQNPWNDSNGQAFLSARDAGVYVSVSAGNDGPGPGTIGSPSNAPWVTTVAAATHDRAFVNSLIDMNGGNATPPADIPGRSITAALPEAPIVYARDYPSLLTTTPELCGAVDVGGMASANPWPPGTFAGEIVVCDRGIFPRVDKCRHVGDAGAAGCVLVNDQPNGNSLIADPHAIPSVHISFANGEVLKAWLDDGAPQGEHLGAIAGTIAVTAPINGDVVAGFSSRGENVPVPDVIKPDVANPGVDVLAAFNSPTPGVGDPEYNIISGTSMSSPHTAGSLALIRALQPDWTPAEAQSAIMSTSVTTLRKEDESTPADPFDQGAGRVDLTQAARAGLLFDEDEPGYTASNPALAGDPKTLNLASLGDNACDGICSWTRVVRSPLDASVMWTASFTSDRPNMIATITPASFALPAGGTQEITIEVDVSGQGQSNPEGWVFGQVELTPDDAAVPAAHLPVAVINIGDADGDGIIDRQDNCTLVNNPSQCDTNDDGYGNHCDADLNNDGGVTQPDLGIFRNQFGMTGSDIDSDLDCSGGVTQTDLGMFRNLFDKPPGPSGEAP